MTKKNKMKEFINNLKLREYELFRKRVMDRCCITRNTFANWKSGAPVAKRYREQLNAIALEITGTKIF